jgi:hypothetical protein
MFRIQRFRNSQDFSVRAYQRFDGEGARTVGRFPKSASTLGRIARSFMRHLLEAMYESRRRQAMAVLRCYRDPMEAEGQVRGVVSQNSARARDGMSFRAAETVAPAIYGMRIRCSITGAPCEGDRAYLCDEWGCARKAGLSPVSHENA